MKTLVVILIVFSFSFVGQAQEITELEETKIGFTAMELIPTENPDEYRYKVNDGYAKEFAENPIGFMESYFDIQSFIEEVKDENYNSYLVRISNEKGFLEANYSKNGELTQTRQFFKDAFMPHDVRNELWRQTEGWSMVKNTYKARGKGNRIDKELYRIKVEKDDKSKIVKIDPKKLSEDQVAGI